MLLVGFPTYSCTVPQFYSVFLVFFPQNCTVQAPSWLYLIVFPWLVICLTPGTLGAGAVVSQYLKCSPTPQLLSTFAAHVNRNCQQLRVVHQVAGEHMLWKANWIRQTALLGCSSSKQLQQQWKPQGKQVRWRMWRLDLNRDRKPDQKKAPWNSELAIESKSVRLLLTSPELLAPRVPSKSNSLCSRNRGAHSVQGWKSVEDQTYLTGQWSVLCRTRVSEPPTRELMMSDTLL